MIAVLKEKATLGVTIKEIDIPKPLEGEVLVKIRAASICGTDIAIYDWTPWAQEHITPPIVIGHEIVGEILKINGNNPRNLKTGDLVSSETHIFCGACSQCRTGNQHICENLKLFGIGRNGGFAEYATIPIKTTWKNNPSVPINWMSAQEPLGNAVHVVNKAEVSGKSVLVIGLGPVGLCAGAVAKAYGATRIIGINPSSYRRNVGLKMGFDEVFETIPGKYIGSCDIVFEMSGHPKGIESALESVKIGGKIMVFGIPKKPVSIDIGKYLINKELSIQSVFGRKIWETWEQTDELLTNHKIDLSHLITHHFALADFEKAVKVMKSEECGKIVLNP